MVGITWKTTERTGSQRCEPDGLQQFPFGSGRRLKPMRSPAGAATNKCLAQNNKSRHVSRATKDEELLGPGRDF
jgi:hypothetical protein